MIHPDVEIKKVNDSIGYGIFATKRIPKGTLTYVKDLLEINLSEKDFSQLNMHYQELIEKYSYRDPLGQRIISWDLGNYVNHSCDSNTMSTAYGFEISIRDIEAGEELTDEYGLFNMASEMSLNCNCQNCRHKITPNDIDLYSAQWDEKILSALSTFNLVEQPLARFLDKNTQHNLNDYLNGRAAYSSVMNLKYHRKPKPSEITEFLQPIGTCA